MFYFWRKSSIFGIFLCGSSAIFAQFIPWNQQIPSSLKPLQNNAQALADLTQEQIFIYAHPYSKTFVPTLKNNPNPNVQFTSSALVVPVSSNEVAKTLTNYSQYTNVFPALKSAQIQEQSGNITRVKYHVTLPTPIPVLNFSEDLVIQHQVEGNSISSLIVDSPMPYAMGRLEWFALTPQSTLITLTQWGDLNQPKGFLISRILAAIPDAKLGIPASTNAFILESLRKKWKNSAPVTLNAGQYPELKLSNEQRGQAATLSLRSAQPVSWIHRPSTVPYQHGRETMRFISTWMYMQPEPQQLEAWLQPDAFKQFFPRQIKDIKVSPNATQGLDSQFKVSVGLGVISIPFNFGLHFNFPSKLSSDYYATGGDLKFIKGKMQFTPLQQGSLLEMTNAAKIHEQAPFLLRAARSLPYHDLLPTVGANTALSVKMKAKAK